MQVSGVFIDSEDGKAVPNVSVQIVDRFGAPTSQGVVSTGAGEFTISSDLLSSDPYYLLYVSAVGYTPQLVDPIVFSRTNVFELTRAYQDLPEAVITPGAGKKTNWAGVLLLVGIGWLLLSNNSKQG